MSLVHIDHFARCLPRLHLLSVWLCWYLDKHYRHTLLTNLFTIDYLTSCDWTSLFSSPFATEPVRFSAVVPDLFARAPEVFCRKLCVYLVCVTGAEEMAGIMGFIYVHTHLHCPVSGTLTRGTHSCWETSLVPAYIETAFTSRGVTQRDYSNWMTRSCKTPRQQFR